MLGLVFGHSAYAITAVLAAFMAGLALGSMVFARRVRAIRNLIGAYGWLEIGIGLSCALVPALLHIGANIYIRLHGALGLSYDAFSVLQFVVVFVLLLPPTMLMGGTLPVLSQALVRHRNEVARSVGTLYSVNTFGAVAGVIAAGYFLLPSFGNLRTIILAVAANLAVGIAAIIYSRRSATARTAADAPLGAPATDAADGATREPASPEPVTGPAASPAGVRISVLAIGISGAVSMIYEVSWTRALSLVIGSSTYAFSAILVAFLVGIAAGSALYSWWWGTRETTPGTLGWLQAGIALMSGALVLVFERMPEVFLFALRHSYAPWFVELVQMLISAGALLPFTLLIGATFPCAVGVVSRGIFRVGRDVGDVYAVNTLGAIVGAVAAGFALIPAVGVNATVKIGIATNLILASVLFTPTLLSGAGRRFIPLWRWSLVPISVAAALGVLLLPAWHPSVMASGAAIYAQKYLAGADRVGLVRLLREQQIVFYRDGRSGTVTVNKSGNHLGLRVNGKADAGTTLDMATQLALGHLPMLVHPDAKRTLVIGLGSGVTAGAILKHPVEHLDIVEIEPAVVEAARFFAEVNGDLGRNPRSTVIIADGRNYLLTTPQRYDAIVSEPSNPWIGGLASLFTREFFELARDRLKARGIMVQWVQGYNIAPDDLRMIISTFRSVFPHVTVWNTFRGGDYVLIGSVDQHTVNLGAIHERAHANPTFLGDLRSLRLQAWPGLLAFFMLGNNDVARLTAGSGINDDDRLPLEFTAPRALYRDTIDANWSLLRRFRSAPVPPISPDSINELRDPATWYSIGLVQLSWNNHRDAADSFEHALKLDPAHTGSSIGASTTYLRLGQPLRALELAQSVIARDPGNGNALYLAGISAQALSRSREAIAFFERAVAANPGDPEFRAAYSRAVLQGVR